VRKDDAQLRRSSEILRPGSLLRVRETYNRACRASRDRIDDPLLAKFRHGDNREWLLVTYPAAGSPLVAEDWPALSASRPERARVLTPAMTNRWG
jgi:hypothetical protein